jgi:PAS domain S-box-containing protein
VQNTPERDVPPGRCRCSSKGRRQVTRGLTVTIRVSLGLACITLSAFLAAGWIGVVPNPYRAALEARARLCETLAVQFCTSAPQELVTVFDTLAPLIMERNLDILSLAVRGADGQIRAATKNHASFWKDLPANQSSETHVQVPIFEGQSQIATFEICLAPLTGKGLYGYLEQVQLPAAAFVAVMGFLAYSVYLRRVLRHLDPSSVIPARVKKVLDVLSDGVVMTDERGRIVLANEAFEQVAPKAESSLIGRTLSMLKWMHGDPEVRFFEPPWSEVLREGVTRRGVPLILEGTQGASHSSLVSATPILGPNGEQRGVLASFTDVTELEKKNQELVDASRRAGMAEIATDVLHNVGNALNRLTVATTTVLERLSASKLPKLRSVAAMISEHQGDLGRFLAEDPQGRHIPSYLVKVTDLLCEEQNEVVKIVQSLAASVDDIGEIVRTQQAHARTSRCRVVTSLSEVCEGALKLNETALKQQGIAVVREFGSIDRVVLDKSRLGQVLCNLIRNAVEALADKGNEEKRLTIRLLTPEEDKLRIEVADNGVGIPAENMTKIFQHGFTTKPEGHGFGLHSSALAAKEMGGSLCAHSDGPDQGALFVLELPLGQKEKSDERETAVESAHTPD